MTPKSISLAGFAAVSLALTVVSAFEVAGEATPYLSAGVSVERRFEAIVSDSYHSGSSLASKELVLKDCQDVSQTIYAKAQPTPRRMSFLKSCAREAEAILATMPTYSRAWLVRAAASAELGDAQEFGRELWQSQRTAPNVHWLAEQRSRLAEQHFDILAASDAGYDYDHDISTLLYGSTGTDIVAQRYVSNPALRSRLTDIVEAAPADAQALFLSRVRRRGGV